MNPTLEIFSQGEEIITGQIADTNAMWLSQQAVAMGFMVSRHTAVGDKLEDLVQVLLDISNRADCCICTGGLGPTSDDLTAEAVAKAFDLPLLFDEIAFQQIQQFFRNRNRQMAECNRKQALLPSGSTRLDNQVGTAPGFALQHRRCWFAFVPGVPSEMRHLFFDRIQPQLKARFNLRPDKLITIKTIGIGESDLQELINNIEIPAEIQLGFRAELGQVQIKLLFPNDYPQQQAQEITGLFTKAIGNPVFAIDGLGNQSGDLISVIDGLMASGGHTLAVVENTSHGLMAAKMVGMTWLLSSVYEQSIEKLAQRLHVEYNPDHLAMTAIAIANAVQQTTKADIVLVQFVARGGYSLYANNDNPVPITSALLVDNQYMHMTRTIAGNMERKQHQAAMQALDLLRLYLQGKKVK